MRPLRVLVGPAAFALLAGCATTGLPSPGRESRERIEALQERVLELQRRAAMNEVEIARLRQQVAAMEARLAREATALPAPPPAAPRAEEERVVVVEPVIEEDEIDVPSVEPSSRPESPASPAAASPDSPSRVDRLPSPESATAETAPVGREGQATYDQAYTLYHQGRYQEAEEGFRRFLADHPNSELSDNAQYWIGAARFARGDHPGALRAFRETVERYPDGNKVPDALYKIGQSLEAVGDLAGAREIYEELTSRFPDTAAASLASDRLESLR